MSGYAAAAVAAAIAVLVVLGVRLAHRWIAPCSEPLQTLPFLSGSLPAEHAMSRFHARWYPATLLFLAFDVEMLFMYPWAVVVADVGISAVVEMFVFLAALLLAALWARREGALRWV